MKKFNHNAIKNIDEAQDASLDEFDDITVVTATAGGDDPSEELEGIDDMDSINNMANMDEQSNRKGMNLLFDTTDMQSTDEINNIDSLSSEHDVGYADDDEESAK